MIFSCRQGWPAFGWIKIFEKIAIGITPKCVFCIIRENARPMDRYEKAIRFAELMAKSLKGELSDEENQEMSRLEEELGNAAKNLERVAERQEIARKMLTWERFDKRRVWRGVRKGMSGPFYRLAGRVVRYAAVLLVPLLLAGVFWRVHEAKMERQSRQYIVDAHFESGKATLELPGGRRIALDTLQKVIRELNQYGIAGGGEENLMYEGKDTVTGGKSDYHRVVVPRGGEYNLRLADGTEVWLFAESELYFPAHFRGKTREVYLSGEGYFEVRHDEARPFVVRTKDLDVKVLGTSFNVKAYSDEDVVETSLVEGRVSVGGRVLRPNVQAVYQKETGEFSYKKINGDNYRLRKERVFVFERERLDDILREIARWYDFEVFYQNPELADKQFGFKLQKYEHVESLLRILELTGEVRFDYKDNVLIVKSNTF